MTNGAGKHGHDDKKGETKQTTKTATAATLKKGVKGAKKPKGK